MKDQLTLLELNEANIELIQSYISDGLHLPNLSKVISNGVKKSNSEEKYELIEPWIQWPSIHTGLSADEHCIFRLGDIEKFSGEQIFERLEELEISVGCVSPMNVENRLKSPGFFIPDPWTNSDTDGSWQSNWIHSAISQAVNDNASDKLTGLSLLKLACALAATLSVKQIFDLTKKLSKLKARGYRRAIFLDCILTEVYIALVKKKKINFGVLFLNGIAHIQHHYLHSSEQNNSGGMNPAWYIGDDPIKFALLYYDELIGKVLALQGFDTLIATGLSQVLFENPVFYYRLERHEDFLKSLDLKFSKVLPRMTRDFLVSFDSNQERDVAKNTLQSLCINGIQIFGTIEERTNELFVTLDYPFEIMKDDLAKGDDGEIKIEIYDHINFVALKNGHHCGTGYVMSSNWSKMIFNEGDNVTFLNSTIWKYFTA